MMDNNRITNLFSVLNAFWRMPPGASWFDRLAKLITNTLESACCYGFVRTSVVPDPPLERKKYIVPDGSGGDWQGHDGEIAVFDPANECWVFFTPTGGQLATMPDGELLFFDEQASSWSPIKAPDLDKYVKKAGDTMSGFLTLHADPTNDSHAATKHYVDARDEALNTELKTYVDNAISNVPVADDEYQHSSAAVKRTIKSRLQDIVTEGDYSDIKARLKASFNKPLAYHIPEGGVTFTVHGQNADFPDLATAFEAMRQWPITTESPVTLMVQKGVHQATKGVVHASPQEGLHITGVTKTVTLTKCVSCEELTYTATVADNWKLGQQFKYHKVTWRLSSVEGLSVGEFILIRSGVSEPWPMPSSYYDNSVFGDENATPEEIAAAESGRTRYRADWKAWAEKVPFYLAYGAHEILSIDSADNQITVLSFNHTAVPTKFPDSPISCTVVQSVIRYDSSNVLENGTTAFVLNSGGYIGNIDNVAFVGRSFPYTYGNRGPYEYQEPVNFYGMVSYSNTRAVFGANSVVCGFCADNLLIGGKCEFYGFTSNSWGHNITIFQHGAMRLDNCVSHGGWLDGVCCQDGGQIAYSRLYLIGNSRAGITFSQGCATAACNFTTAVFNGTKITGAEGTGIEGSAAGISILGGAIMVANNSLSAHNVGFGISVNHAASATVRFARVFNNSAYGLRALAGASVSADQGSFYNNAIGQGFATENPFDVLASNGAVIALANNINATTTDSVRCNPILNMIGRRGGFITGTDEKTHSGTPDSILSIGAGSALNNVRDLTFWHTGRLLIGGLNAPGDYGGPSYGAVEVECNGHIAAHDVFPRTDNERHLGLGHYKWSDIWCANSTIQTSDWRIKDEITPSPLGLRFLRRLTPVRFKWLDYTETRRKYRTEIQRDGHGHWIEKHVYDGDETVEHTFRRPHYGIIAQQFRSAFLAEGESDCAAYIEDPESDSVSLRYGELTAILIRAIQELAERVEALEAKTGIEPAQWTPPPMPDFGLSKRTERIHPINEYETPVDIRSYEQEYLNE